MGILCPLNGTGIGKMSSAPIEEFEYEGTTPLNPEGGFLHRSVTHVDLVDFSVSDPTEALTIANDGIAEGTLGSKYTFDEFIVECLGYPQKSIIPIIVSDYKNSAKRTIQERSSTLARCLWRRFLVFDMEMYRKTDWQIIKVIKPLHKPIAVNTVALMYRSGVTFVFNRDPPQIPSQPTPNLIRQLSRGYTEGGLHITANSIGIIVNYGSANLNPWHLLMTDREDSQRLACSLVVEKDLSNNTRGNVIRKQEELLDAIYGANREVKNGPK